MFNVQVFSGAESGPTGLSVGVSAPNYGPTLAAFLGCSFERNSINVQLFPPSHSLGIIQKRI